MPAQSDFALFDLLPDPIQIVDQDGHIVHMNDKMQAMFGNLTGQICHQALKKSGAECRNCPRHRLGRHAFKDEQVEIDAVNGRNYLVNHSTMVINGGQHVVETYKDITDYKRLVQENAQVTAGIGIAREVQNKCITVEQNIPGFAVQYRYLPSHLIAGDFLNVHFWHNRYLAIAVADVSGHGIGAAAVTFLLKTVYDQLCRERLSLSDFVRKLQRQLRGYLLPARFVTFALVLIDTKTMTGEIINAGHPPLLHIAGAGGSVRRHGAHMPPVGIAPVSDASLPADAFTLAPGDRLLIYTDGVFQMFNREFAPFLRRVTQLAGAPQQEIFSALLPPEEVPLEDDFTLLLLDVLTPPPADGSAAAH